MAYWDALGRALMAQAPEETANQIAEFLQENGMDVTVSGSPGSDSYDVLIPRIQEYEGVLLLEKYYEREKEKAAREASYRSDWLASSPDFVPSEEKFRTSTNSSFLYVLFGSFICLMAMFHFFLLLYHRESGRISASVLELILGFVFVLFGISTNQKVRLLKDKILEENAFNDQVIRWYTTTYSPEHMDKSIDAAAGNQELTEEERAVRRRRLIQDYILREYDIPDQAYLDYITDIIYKKLFFPNSVSSAM